MNIDEQDMYRELGETQRFMLRWREGLFSGFLIVLGALAIAFHQVWSLTPENTASRLEKFAWAVPLTGTFLAVIFSIIDKRCHEVLRRNYELGEKLEKRTLAQLSGQVEGVYTASRRPGTAISHTAVLQCFYLCSGAILLVLSIILLISTGIGGHGGK